MNQRKPRKHRARNWRPYRTSDFTRREMRIDYQRRKRRLGALDEGQHEEGT